MSDLSKATLPLPSERGPYRVAVYDKDDKLVVVVEQARVDNVRPMVEELVKVGTAVVNEFVEMEGRIEGTPKNIQRLAASLREVEAALKG